RSGHFVIQSPLWNGGNTQVGAVTWGNAYTGFDVTAAGNVTSNNSLVGSRANDHLGSGGIAALANGNYLVCSPEWDNGAAAPDAEGVTWANGYNGINGAVTKDNSLVGTTTNDKVGSDGVIELENGNFVVGSPDWNNGAALGAGAVTWGNGTVG